MLGKAKKRASRVGCRPVKIHFAVEIESVCFPSRCLVADQAILSVCFERKTKSTATGNFVRKASPKEKECVVVVEESLEMVTVLFKDPRTKRHQKKAGKLVLRELSKQGIFGQYNYKVLGRCDLNLHQIADELGSGSSVKRCGIVVYDNLKGVVLKFSAVATVQSVDSGCQLLDHSFDTASEASDVSDVSELTSTSLSGNANGAGAESDVYMVFESAPPRTHIGSYLDSTLQQDAVQERIEEENSESERSPSAASGLEHSPEPPRGTELSSPRMSASSATSTTSALTRLLARASDIPAIKHVFAMYDQEMRLRGEHVTQLEQRLVEITAERSILRSEASDEPDEPDEQPQQQGTEAAILHSQVVVDLQAELRASRLTEERLRCALEAEMIMVREAARAAADSAVLRAEADDECQALLTELIALKVRIIYSVMNFCSQCHCTFVAPIIADGEGEHEYGAGCTRPGEP